MDIRDLKKEIWKAYNERSVWTQKSDVDKFKKLLDELDEPKKVYIPQFVAHWIEEAKEHYGSEIDPLNIVYWIGDYIGNIDPHYEWLENIYNQKLLLNAAINGYEVKKEPKYRIKLPGLAGSNGQQYISKSADGKLFACARCDYLQQEFTGDELKQLPDWVRRLEFEEVEG
ncbi:DUF1642 domain-containing protein [Pediococcus acidilactici]|uniref:DUF1642 domain-containing protein n=1 Tax=Pediococcus acidilactici TaxID=1254 RepID=UPI0019119E91|nr:DUF1642 domain-containing protein [Pediococcus acidilactici]QQP83908.1 DUF1642 domain-containing protein [Pediococcus acidilactici]